MDITKEQKMKAIILASGIGKRMGKSGEKLPKCLFKIGGETILDIHLRILKKCGIKDITVVVGSKGKCWGKKNIKKIRKSCPNIVINSKNIELKRTFSLKCALDKIPGNDDVLIFDGDAVFEEGILKKVISERRENLVSSVFVESRFIDDMGAKIIDNGKGKVRRIDHGLESEKLFTSIFKIGKNDLALLKKLLSKRSWKKNLTDVLDEFSKKTGMHNITFNTSVSRVSVGDIRYEKKWEAVENDLERRGSVMRKTAGKHGEERLVNEVKWIKSLPLRAKRHFPEIISYSLKKPYVYYDMKYYPHPNMSNMLFEKKISTEKSVKIIKGIFDFMFREIYRLGVKNPEIGFIRKEYINKFYKRVKAIEGKSELIDKIFKTEKIVINGKEMENASSLIKKISEDMEFMSSLEPPEVSLFHGDFRFDNMLIDKEKEDFILIDPRGSTASGKVESDKIEDLAKFFAPHQNLYNLYRSNLFDVQIKEVSGRFSLGLQLKRMDLVRDFNKIKREMLKKVRTYEKIKKDENWEKRMHFMEAMITLANAPYQLKKRDSQHEKMVLGIYIGGVVALNEFIKKYPLGKDKKFMIMNINTPEDYEKAKKIF